MIEIVLATANPHKVDEINAISHAHGVNFIKVNEGFDPIENGSTFEENSVIKARTASLLMNEYALADDTGLCVEALDGRPGLYSARYAPTQVEKISKLLGELSGVDEANRNAEFVCSMALTDRYGNVVHKTKGVCKGSIAVEPAGCGGFGYDPLFLVSGLGKTMAELTADEKNSLSHRALALLPMLEWIKENLN